MKTNPKSQIIQAIKELDIDKLGDLLDDDRSYMKVTKTLFLSKLSEKFEAVRKEGKHSFDDVFFGVCGSCVEGCEGITFLCDSGLYLDLCLEEENDEVVDICVCHQLVNFIALEKKQGLGFSFTKDEQVDFQPSSEYLEIEQAYKTLVKEMSLFTEPIKLDDFVTWFAHFYNLREFVSHLNPYYAVEFNLYTEVLVLISQIESIITLKTREHEVVDILIDYQNAKTERDQLIWLFEHRDDYFKLNIMNVPHDFESHSCIQVNLKDQIVIDISGYAHVLDCIVKVDTLNNYFLDKYKPLKEFYERRPLHDRDSYSLEELLFLHDVHLDVLIQFRDKFD